MRALTLSLVVSALLISSASAREVDEAWRLYADAYEATLKGDEESARVLLDRIRREYPNHEAAKRAVQAQKLSPPPREHSAPGQLGELLRAEEPAALARAELAILQTFSGIAAGLEVCFVLPCSDARPFVVSALLGGGAGLGASLYLSRDGVTPGHALAINSGTLWGAANAALLTRALSSGDRATPGIILAGQLGGTAIGHYAWSSFKPGAGDVSAMNSGGLWALLINLLVQNAAQTNLSDSAYYGTMIASANLGLIGGGLLASYMPMSRSRTLVIDAGGVLGMLLGFATDVLVEGTSPSDRTFFGLGALGAATGLVSATLLTQSWDLDALPPVQMALLPTRGGATLMAGMAW